MRAIAQQIRPFYRSVRWHSNNKQPPISPGNEGLLLLLLQCCHLNQRNHFDCGLGHVFIAAQSWNLANKPRRQFAFKSFAHCGVTVRRFAAWWTAAIRFEDYYNQYIVDEEYQQKINWLLNYFYVYIFQLKMQLVVLGIVPWIKKLIACLIIFMYSSCNQKCN